MSDLCRLCSSQLRGSRRKWLFGGSGSLLPLFSQVLGTPILRNPPGSAPKPGKGKGRPEDAEFLCGKCCHSLNVYHRYDLVLFRMRELYEQRSTRLVTEKDKLSFTLRTIHARAWGLPLPEYHGHHQDRNTYGYRGSYNDLSSSGSYKSRNNSLSPGYQNSCPNSPFPDRLGSFHGSLGSLSSDAPSKSYQKLLEQDRSLWEHESWWDDRHRGCSRCIKGEKCHSCSSWRVSDANYESVCTVPRRRKHSRGTDDGSVLLRSKSLGSVGGESASSKGSLLSLSASSLDSLSFVGEEGDGGVFWEAKSPLPSSPPSSFPLPKPGVGEVLKSLKEIKYSPVKTPTRSKIPIRSQQKTKVEDVDQYVEDGVYERPPVEEPAGDLDVYMGIGPEVCRTQASCFLHIQETLKWLQTNLKTTQSCGTLSGQQDQVMEQQELIRELIKRLKFKDEVLEESLTLLLTLPVASDPYGELITDFVEKLRAQEEQIKKEGDEVAEIKRQREAEVKRLHEELRAREEDITRLSKVLRDNQDTITALRDILGEKDFTIQRMEVALDSSVRSSASQDALRLAALREKDSLIAAVQGALSSSNQDVEALADSLLSQGLDDLSTSIPGLSAPNPLMSQLQEKGRLLSQAHADNQRQSIQHQRDIQDLLNALNESQTLLQEQLRHCKKRLQDGAQEQKTLREALRAKEKELQEERRRHSADQHQVSANLMQLQDSARERDQATKKLLQDAESRDQLIKKLQERLKPCGEVRDTL
ncbi:nuclear mitotic apparatus protein 1-like [Bufo bufo]|uniref:nuclear mitotic apparatus protein 1-like n=1 Tax=Bufo bufo TaxID=8384 RepID=UPI001ABDB594|nr:nuclear mitotic apparatus protein 1-like [Bufo bufo]XP_040261401.1 nuclear mitotic apparatus protein 1-like [Bufo bufo]XP_040261402.1 nuclear mitotic apparatus protein 1-like [Bufo bufo]XP_040261403.1 nuclear mitotic apparatus protein 1-like [Bufo bufo]